MSPPITYYIWECCDFRKEFCYGTRKTVLLSASPEWIAWWRELSLSCTACVQYWDLRSNEITVMLTSCKPSTRIWQALFTERELNLHYVMVMHSVSCGVYWEMNVTSPSSSSLLHPRCQQVHKVICCVFHLHLGAFWKSLSTSVWWVPDRQQLTWWHHPYLGFSEWPSCPSRIHSFPIQNIHLHLKINNTTLYLTLAQVKKKLKK